MSKVTRKINKISMAVIGLSGRLVFYALVAVLLVVGAKSGYEFGHSIFFAPGIEAEPGTDITFPVGGTETVGQIGDELMKAGLIRDDSAFTIQAVFYGYKVKEGTFALNTSMTSKEIIMGLKADVDGEKEE